MLKYCITACILLCSFCCTAQSVTFNVITNVALNWNINSITNEENSQTIGGALTLQLKNRSGGTKDVYARLSNVTVPVGFSLNKDVLQVDYTSDDSNREQNLITTPVTLTTTDQRLFSLRQYATNTSYNFYYNTILLPTEWEFVPGNYSYTILFTFVAP